MNCVFLALLLYIITRFRVSNAKASCRFEHEHVSSGVALTNNEHDMFVTEGCRETRFYRYTCDGHSVATNVELSAHCYRNDSHYVTDWSSDSNVFQRSKSRTNVFAIETSPVRKENAGSYICKLEGVDVEEDRFNLFVEGFPQPTLSVEKTCPTAQSGSASSTACEVTLRCTIECYSSRSTDNNCETRTEPTVSFERDGQIVSEGLLPPGKIKVKSWQLRLQPEEEAGTYCCKLQMPEEKFCSTNGSQSNCIQIPEVLNTTRFSEKTNVAIVPIVAGVSTVLCVSVLVFILICVFIYTKRRRKIGERIVPDIVVTIESLYSTDAADDEKDIRGQYDDRVSVQSSMETTV